MGCRATHAAKWLLCLVIERCCGILAHRKCGDTYLTHQCPITCGLSHLLVNTEQIGDDQHSVVGIDIHQYYCTLYGVLISDNQLVTMEPRHHAEEQESKTTGSTGWCAAASLINSPGLLLISVSTEQRDSYLPIKFRVLSESFHPQKRCQGRICGIHAWRRDEEQGWERFVQDLHVVPQPRRPGQLSSHTETRGNATHRTALRAHGSRQQIENTGVHLNGLDLLELVGCGIFPKSLTTSIYRTSAPPHLRCII